MLPSICILYIQYISGNECVNFMEIKYNILRTFYLEIFLLYDWCQQNEKKKTETHLQIRFNHCKSQVTGETGTAV